MGFSALVVTAASSAPAEVEDDEDEGGRMCSLM